MAAEPPCHLVTNEELDYPYCCPRYDCSTVDEDKVAENEVFTGEEGGAAKDLSEVDELYMSASEDRSPITVEYDVTLEGDSGSSSDKVVNDIRHIFDADKKN